jgi:transcriptional regulator with XRE-family HTH domain
MGRSAEKRITREAQVLRFMRNSRKLSLNQSGRKMKITGSAIAHMEQGRMDISRERIAAMINAYGYTFEEYLEYFDGKELPLNYRAECAILLNNLTDDQVRIVHGLMDSLVRK